MDVLYSTEPDSRTYDQPLRVVWAACRPANPVTLVLTRRSSSWLPAGRSDGRRQNSGCNLYLGAVPRRDGGVGFAVTDAERAAGER
jgi:hypothetical protein